MRANAGLRRPKAGAAASGNARIYGAARRPDAAPCVELCDTAHFAIEVAPRPRLLAADQPAAGGELACAGRAAVPRVPGLRVHRQGHRRESGGVTRRKGAGSSYLPPRTGYALIISVPLEFDWTGRLRQVDYPCRPAMEGVPVPFNSASIHPHATQSPGNSARKRERRSSLKSER